MRRYETIVILTSEISDDLREQMLSKIKAIIEEKGILLDFEKWGIRKLAYEIKKKQKGYYLKLDYCGNGELVNELERIFKLDDKYLKFITILIAEDVNPETAKEEIEKKKEASKKFEENKAKNEAGEK